MVHNTDLAIKIASEKTKSVVKEYTVAPKFLNNYSGCHEWIIEFEINPKNINEFITILDLKLQEINSDYEAKRSKDLLLKKREAALQKNLKKRRNTKLLNKKKYASTFR